MRFSMTQVFLTALAVFSVAEAQRCNTPDASNCGGCPPLNDRVCKSQDYRSQILVKMGTYGL
ncbi:hypothetical protein HYFRA_00000501 [Hymenoscyphus fraxineus]|uniref:Uncharacterized protein n=1 Tax=Hymenoscyphus fraxineus TaxID=746836 RepID=A0A9N9L703_9HELO|nr:hypothetical protein HYFRA_00000501 [Hymenoscyphus fraxineus]